MDECVRQGLLCFAVTDPSMHVGNLSIFRGIKIDRGTILSKRGIVAKERAQDRRLCGHICCLRRLFVGDLVDERLETNDVAKELSFIAPVGAHLTRPVDEFDACHPFVYRQLGLSCKVVNVPYQTRHDLVHPRRGLGAHGLNHTLGEF